MQMTARDRGSFKYLVLYSYEKEKFCQKAVIQSCRNGATAAGVQEKLIFKQEKSYKNV